MIKYLRWIAGTLIAATLALVIACWILLPENIIVQVSFSGAPSTMQPKVFALALGALLGLGGSLAALRSQADVQQRGKWLIMSGVGVLALGLVLAVNLLM